MTRLFLLCRVRVSGPGDGHSSGLWARRLPWCVNHAWTCYPSHVAHYSGKPSVTTMVLCPVAVVNYTLRSSWNMLLCDGAYTVILVFHILI